MSLEQICYPLGLILILNEGITRRDTDSLSCFKDIYSISLSVFWMQTSTWKSIFFWDFLCFLERFYQGTSEFQGFDTQVFEVCKGGCQWMSEINSALKQSPYMLQCILFLGRLNGFPPKYLLPFPLI